MAKIMFFNEDKVRNRVISGMHTITIRAKPTDELRSVVHGGLYTHKKDNVVIRTNTLYDMRGIDEALLEEHVHDSGFETVKEWVAAINRQHKPKATDTLYIIHVIRVYQ